MKPKSNKKRLSLAVPRKSLPFKKARKTGENPNASQDNLDDTLNKSMTPQRIESDVEDVSDITLYREFAEKAVKNLQSKVEKDSKSQELFEDDKLVLLQVVAGKIPKGPIKTLHISLTHSILPADHEILLITPDMKDNVKDYEKNIEHYTKLLVKNDIKGIGEIIPLHKLRAEYGEYEMQNKLMGLYDLIICDQSVINYVKTLIGSVMNKRNKHLAGLKLQVSNLKTVFEKAIASTYLNIHGKGDCFTLNLGHTGMEEEHLVDNIMAAADGLKTKFPGGFQYILGLHLKTPKSKAIQFYKSSSNFATMKQPAIATNTPKQNVTDELSTAMDARVTVTPTGDVYVLNGNYGKRIRKQTQRLQMPVPVKAQGKKRKAKKTVKDDVVGGKKKRAAGKPKSANTDAKSAKTTKEKPVKAAAKANKAEKAEKPSPKPKAPKGAKGKVQENGKEEVAAKAPKQVKGKAQENGKEETAAKAPKEAKGKAKENGKEETAAKAPKEVKVKAVKEPKAKGSKVENAADASPKETQKKEKKANGKAVVQPVSEQPEVSDATKKKAAPKRKKVTDEKESKVVAKKKGKVPAAKAEP